MTIRGGLHRDQQAEVAEGPQGAKDVRGGPQRRGDTEGAVEHRPGEPWGCQKHGYHYHASRHGSQGNSISGHVCKPDGRPLDGAYLTVYSSPDDDLVASGSTNWFGHYEVVGLPAGNYNVKADCYGYAEEFHDDATPANATLVSVALGDETSGINLTLGVGGYMSGCVHDSQGTRIPWASIAVYDSTSHNQVGWGYANS